MSMWDTFLAKLHEIESIYAYLQHMWLIVKNT